MSDGKKMARYSAADSGLRFAAADDGSFVCPQCREVIAGEFFV